MANILPQSLLSLKSLGDISFFKCHIRHLGTSIVKIEYLSLFVSLCLSSHILIRIHHMLCAQQCGALGCCRPVSHASRQEEIYFIVYHVLTCLSQFMK